MFPVDRVPGGHPFPVNPFPPRLRIAFPPSPFGEIFKYIPFLILIWSK